MERPRVDSESTVVFAKNNPPKYFVCTCSLPCTTLPSDSVVWSWLDERQEQAIEEGNGGEDKGGAQARLVGKVSVFHATHDERPTPVLSAPVTFRRFI